MKTIKVPDSWNEVTVSQFQEINSIPLESKSRALEIISILINEDIEEIRKYDMQSLNRIVAALGWCDELPSDKDFEEVLTLDGTNYHMVKMSSFSVGEWIDLEQYFEDPINNLHNILGVFYRDNDLPYDTITSEKRASIFRDKVNVGQVYGTVVFFCNIEKNCIQTIAVYFQLEIMKMEMSQKPKQKRIPYWRRLLRLKSGDGTPTYTA
jgi:hypothetical protein